MYIDIVHVSNCVVFCPLTIKCHFIFLFPPSFISLLYLSDMVMSFIHDAFLHQEVISLGAEIMYIIAKTLISRLYFKFQKSNLNQYIL